ncbi:methyltransferase [Bordetella genomosp. 13]|uniref:Methyltransferase n=2 Tax=Bordetella genomosp. 13 TaxID=463040 RepID=A0A1W6ZIV5_9BORD|nr:methyltransferase [Bordetella genomosp. 13]
MKQIEAIVNNALQQQTERRRGYKAQMAVSHLGIQHTENCRVLPDRELLLSRIPSGGVCAEIGAAFGDYTDSILSLNKPKQLHLVDAWDSDRYRQGLQQIRHKFAKEIQADQLCIHQGLSVDKLLEFKDNFFDWVYIDTNHSYETTLDELKICNRKVKPGGRIAGHDFCTGNVISPVPYGVVEAVTQFCVEDGWQYEYVTLEYHGHFSFCLTRL